MASKKKPKKVKVKKTGVAGLKKSDLQQYNKLKQQVSRAKRDIAAQNKKFKYGQKKGKVNKPRTVRSQDYLKLTTANKELIDFRNKHNIGEEVIKPPINTKGRKKFKKTTIEYSRPVWQYEREFSQDVNNRLWKTIVFSNSGKMINGKKSAPSEIFNIYDTERNNAYIKLFSTTPVVNIIEDEGTNTLTLEFIS